MEQNSNSIEGTSKFSKRFMIWCVGGGFLLAMLYILICLGVIPFQILKYRVGGGAGVAFNFTMMTLGLELFILLIISVVGGLMDILLYCKNKQKWKGLSIFLLIFVIIKLITIFYICSPALNPDIWGYLNLIDVGLAFILIGLMIIWFTIWLIVLYRKEKIKFISNMSLVNLGLGFGAGICTMILYFL